MALIRTWRRLHCHISVPVVLLSLVHFIWLRQSRHQLRYAIVVGFRKHSVQIRADTSRILCEMRLPSHIRCFVPVA